MTCSFSGVSEVLHFELPGDQWHTKTVGELRYGNFTPCVRPHLNGSFEGLREPSGMSGSGNKIEHIPATYKYLYKYMQAFTPTTHEKSLQEWVDNVCELKELKNSEKTRVRRIASKVINGEDKPSATGSDFMRLEDALDIYGESDVLVYKILQELKSLECHNKLEGSASVPGFDDLYEVLLVAVVKMPKYHAVISLSRQHYYDGDGSGWGYRGIMLEAFRIDVDDKKAKIKESQLQNSIFEVSEKFAGEHFRQGVPLSLIMAVNDACSENSAYGEFFAEITVDADEDEATVIFSNSTENPSQRPFSDRRHFKVTVDVGFKPLLIRRRKVKVIKY